jgi:hypothetical protein
MVGITWLLGRKSVKLSLESKEQMFPRKKGNMKESETGK